MSFDVVARGVFQANATGAGDSVAIGGPRHDPGVPALVGFANALVDPRQTGCEGQMEFGLDSIRPASDLRRSDTGGAGSSCANCRPWAGIFEPILDWLIFG